LARDGRLTGHDGVVPGHLLVVRHPRPRSVASLAEAVERGFADAGTDLRVRSLTAPEAGEDDVEAASGTVLITTENFGMVSGLMKDFLERIYPWFEETPNRRPGMPYVLVSKGGSDGTGAVRDVTRILTGLRWKEVAPPLVIAGSCTAEHLAQARELGGTLAAGVDAGMY
jgi:hypothetical protein